MLNKTNRVGCKDRFYIDLDHALPEIVFWNERIARGYTRIPLSASNPLPGARSEKDQYTLAYRQWEKREKQRIKEAAQNLPKVISEDVDYIIDGHSQIHTHAFMKTYVSILRENDISPWMSWYDAIRESEYCPAGPIWDVEVDFDEHHLPEVIPELMPKPGKKYRGGLGFGALFVLLENGKAVILYAGEFASVKITNITQNAINRIRVNAYQPLRSKTVSMQSRERMRTIERFARKTLSEVRQVKAVNLVDTTIVGRLTWYKDPQKALGVGKTYQDGDWSCDEEIKNELIVWLNTNHPVFLTIEELVNKGKHNEAICFMRYLYYRLLLKAAGPNYYSSRPDATKAYRFLADIVEEEYGMMHI